MLRTRRTVGFTLIELLVVIAIIAILAAILFPIFAQARATAQLSVCQSNDKQMGIAMIMYKDDYAQRWMPAQTTVSEWAGYDHNGTIVYWDQYGNPIGGQIAKFKNPIIHGYLDKYLKTLAVYACPVRPGKGSQSILALNDWQAYWSSYGPNERSAFHGSEDPNFWPIGAKDSQLEEPSYTILLWEHYIPGIICEQVQAVSNWCKVCDPALADHFKAVHRHGADFLWADGHVKSLSMGQLHRAMFSIDKSIYRTAALAPQNYCH